MFFTLATSLRTCFLCASQSGSGQARSPVVSPARRTRSISFSSFPNKPEAHFPSATTQAPVSVARSIIDAGSNSVRA